MPPTLRIDPRARLYRSTGSSGRDPVVYLPSPILDSRLYISDSASAEDPSTLQRLRITHILTVMRRLPALPSSLHINRYHLPIEDTPFAELAAHLPHTTAWIESALEDPEARVLVHCAKGISRSVSVVSGYLMYAYDLEPEEAVREIRRKRPIAKPNCGFVQQLYEYYDQLHRPVYRRVR